MITTAPLPALVDLLAPARSPDRQALARPWLRNGDLAGRWLSRSTWSLAALADTFARIHGRLPVMAFPEYFCNGSLGPLRLGRADLAFYPVGHDLTPDWEGCDRLGRIDIFVLVHTFGWANAGPAARHFCDGRGAWLVEDAAHVLAPIPGIGEWGDAIAYSPHKLLAAPDGAVLVVRGGLEAVQPHLDDSIRALGPAQPSTASWRIKRLLQRSPVGAMLMRRHGGGQPDFATDPAGHPLAQTPALSCRAAAVIGRADLAGIARARAANYTALLAAIGEMADWRPMFELGEGVAPYRLAMRCADRAVATRLYARLRQANLPVESWPDLPPEVAEDSVARRLRNSVLLLPCHQGCAADELAGAYAAALGQRP